MPSPDDVAAVLTDARGWRPYLMAASIRFSSVHRRSHDQNDFDELAQLLVEPSSTRASRSRSPSGLGHSCAWRVARSRFIYIVSLAAARGGAEGSLGLSCRTIDRACRPLLDGYPVPQGVVSTSRMTQPAETPERVALSPAWTQDRNRRVIGRGWAVECSGSAGPSPFRDEGQVTTRGGAQN
jgi:hypothetical protein